MALCGLVTVVGSSPTLTDAEEILYLSPSGNDAWSGTLPAPNPGKSDGPLATLERARKAVRVQITGGLEMTFEQNNEVFQS